MRLNRGIKVGLLFTSIGIVCLYYYWNSQTFSQVLMKMLWEGEIATISKAFDMEKQRNYRMFAEYLGPIKNEPMKVLELGLECSKSNQTVKSVKIWRKYLPNSQMAVLEEDPVCADTVKTMVDYIIIGNQADLRVLDLAKFTAFYSVIIDYGGKTRKQQVNSLIGLWPYLGQGGIYIMENVSLSFLDKNNDNVDSSYDIIIYLITKLLFPDHIDQELIKNFKNIVTDVDIVYESLVSINCFKEACVFIKK